MRITWIALLGALLPLVPGTAVGRGVENNPNSDVIYFSDGDGGWLCDNPPPGFSTLDSAPGGPSFNPLFNYFANTFYSGRGADFGGLFLAHDISPVESVGENCDPSFADLYDGPIPPPQQ